MLVKLVVVEQRYRAALKVLEGAETVHGWLRAAMPPTVGW